MIIGNIEDPVTGYLWVNFTEHPFYRYWFVILQRDSKP